MAGAGTAGTPDAGAGGGGEPSGPVTCATLIAEDDMLLSGAYALDPDGDGPVAPFQAYCEMELGAGGWTLLGSFLDSSFDVDESGSSTKPCYEEACINRAYSTLPLGRDLLIEWADLAIAGSSIDGRATFSRVDSGLSGRTLKAVFLAAEPSFVQAPSTTVIPVWFNGKDCASWPNWGAGICQIAVQVVLQDPACGGAPVFHIGIGNNFMDVQGNCAGWPQSPGNDFPRAYRFWTR